jgi:signal transduction histidine kinase
MTPVDINELIGKLIDFLSPQFAKHGINVERRLAAGLPRLVLDPDLMQQALLNISLNAIKAMPEGGKFSVETRAEERKGDIPGAIMIVFTDSGEGISPENLDRIFSPFFTTRQQGTGLGLSITQRIVEQHKGELSVESTPGKGATFTITLPLPKNEERTRNV